MGNSQQVFQSIFNRSMLENDSKDFLTGIAEEYPYFTAAQFYLLQKSEPGSDAYNKQLAKAAILFNNPFWLCYQLEQSFGSPELPLPITVHVAEDDSIYHAVSDDAETVQPISETLETILDQQIFGAETDGTEEISFEKNREFPMDSPPKVIGSSLTSEVTEHGEDITPDVVEKIIGAGNIPEPETDAETPALTAEEVQHIRDYNEGIILEKTGEANSNSQLESDTSDRALVFIPTEISNVPKNNNGNDGAALEETFDNNAIEPGIENKFAPTSEPTVTNPAVGQKISDDNPEEPGEEFAEKEIEPLRFTLNFTNATATTEDTIEFEPLHTSDYFASLGIKFSDEVRAADDKFGKNLKSFTEWLKTMKKIHPDQLPKQSAQSETIIQQMAEKSNIDGEVLTETMAEVLLQQGKLGKAIEVYHKLSLLNPLKSGYFASKIDEIER